MNQRQLAAASAAAVLIMFVGGGLAAASMPVGARVAVHWGLDGEANGFANAWTAFLLIPLVAAALSVLFYALPKLEPRAEALAQSAGLVAAIWFGMLVVLGAAQVAILSAALGWGIPAPRLVIAALGVLFILMGNQLAKSRPMFLVGIRTPWSLSSEEVWVKTHRLAGKLTFSGGALLFLCALAPVAQSLLWPVVLAVCAAVALIPVAYSYFAWRRGQASR